MPYDLEIEDYDEDVSINMVKKCIVTGGAGFIGSNIVDRLVKEGHEVHIIDDLSTGSQYNINPKAKFHKMDITEMNVRGLCTMFEDADMVFHLAAFPRVEPSIQEPVHAHNINVNGTLNMLKACVDYGVQRFIFTSSSAVYGEASVPTDENHPTNPMSPYALHKLIGEQYCKLFSDLYGLETICLRYSNAYGEGQPTEGAYCNVMGIFQNQKDQGSPMTIVGDGSQRRDFVHVKDIVDANMKAMNHHQVEWMGEVFNIGYGVNYSVNQIARWMGGETTNIPPRIEPKETLLNSDKAYRVLGWEPTIDLQKWLEEKDV